MTVWQVVRCCAAALAAVPAIARAQTTDPGAQGTIQAYRNNYVLAGFDRDAQVKFQVSVQSQLLRHTPLFFAYSQRSFWDLYDWERSTPFRESNYNPEMLYRLTFGDGTSPDHLQLAVEHESNGKDSLSSRSWNKVTGAARFSLWSGVVTVVPRVWVPFAVADENRDIRDFYGWGDVMLVLSAPPGAPQNRLEVLLRPAPGSPGRTISLQVHWVVQPLTTLGIDIFGLNPSLMFQYWHGFGESLIDYKIRTTRFRAGIMF